MHELSIAQSIVELAINEMKKANATLISEMELEIGQLAGVEYQAFQFALDSFSQQPELRTTKYIIHKPEGKAICANCKTVYETSSIITQCPECDEFGGEIIQGRELRLRSIIVD